MERTNDREIYQPIHPTTRPLLDPGYVAFHDQYFQYVVPDDQKVWDGSARLASPSWPSTALVLPEQMKSAISIQDIPLEHFELRVFTPRDKTQKPAAGWPVFMWFHGGGWALGSIADNNDLCMMICHTANCVVVSVGYRLAPEYPYPVPVEDAVEALHWIHSAEGTQALHSDNLRIGIGGLSAGGNLAAVLSLKAANLTPAIPIAFQILIVPVVDNTATVDTVWAANKHAPWLTPARMTWYRRMYLPKAESDAQNWDVSPNLAPDDLLAKSPQTWIAVAEHDLLAPEGKAYAGRLAEVWGRRGRRRSEGSKTVIVKEYEGSTHSILSMAGVLSKGRGLIHDVAEQIRFWFSY